MLAILDRHTMNIHTIPALTENILSLVKSIHLPSNLCFSLTLGIWDFGIQTPSNMAARFSSTAILRSALATHVSLSASSLLCSAFGPSQLPSLSEDSSEEHQTSSQYNQQEHLAKTCAALPWLDQLHNTIASMYVTGGINECCCTPYSSSNNIEKDIMVQVASKVAFENPLLAYTGLRELERAFKGRMYLHPQNDVKTLLECVNVQASEDSICGGEHQQHIQQHALNSIPSAITPKVEVTYRLSQKFGAYFSVHSLLVVTVQVRRGTSQKVRQIISDEQKVAMPLATSGFTHRAAVSTVAAATAQYSVPATVALAKAASKIFAGTRGSSCSGSGFNMNGSAPLVAEVIRIEEQWNGVQLLRFTPFHWSRRLNGLVAGSAAFFFFR